MPREWYGYQALIIIRFILAVRFIYRWASIFAWFPCPPFLYVFALPSLLSRSAYLLWCSLPVKKALVDDLVMVQIYSSQQWASALARNLPITSISAQKHLSAEQTRLAIKYDLRPGRSFWTRDTTSIERDLSGLYRLAEMKHLKQNTIQTPLCCHPSRTFHLHQFKPYSHGRFRDFTNRMYILWM